MAFGMQALGDSGGVLFDTSDPNYGLHSSGSVSTSNTGDVLTEFIGYGSTGYGLYGNRTQATITLPSTNALLFIRSSTPVLLLSQNGLTATVISPNGSSATVDYKIFVPLRELTLSGSMGLEVFDASGSLTFSSRGSPLILRHVGSQTRGAFTESHSITGAYVAAPPFNRAHTSVIDYIDPISLYVIAMYGLMVTCSDTQVVASMQEITQAFYPVFFEEGDPLGGTSTPILLTS